MPLPSLRTQASRSPCTSPAQAVISDTTRPAPSRSASRRKGVSVMPDIGAKITRFGTVSEPIAKGRPVKRMILPRMGRLPII